MNRLLSLAILFLSVLSVKAEDITFKIASVPLNEEFKATVLQFDGSKLTYITEGKEALIIPLTEVDLTKLHLALTTNDYKAWSGFWANPKLVEGAFYSIQATVENKTHQFTSINGCPPGFAKIAEVINQITVKPLILQGWNILENGSIQHGSFKQYQLKAFRETKQLEYQRLKK